MTAAPKTFVGFGFGAIQGGFRGVRAPGSVIAKAYAARGGPTPQSHLKATPMRPYHHTEKAEGRMQNDLDDRGQPGASWPACRATWRALFWTALEAGGLGKETGIGRRAKSQRQRRCWSRKR